MESKIQILNINLVSSFVNFVKFFSYEPWDLIYKLTLRIHFFMVNILCILNIVFIYKPEITSRDTW